MSEPTTKLDKMPGEDWLAALIFKAIHDAGLEGCDHCVAHDWEARTGLKEIYATEARALIAARAALAGGYIRGSR